MLNTLNTWRKTSILSVGLIVAAGLATTATSAQAQEAARRYRVMIPNPTVQDGAKDNFAKSVANETKKLIDGMLTHRSLEKKDLDALLKRFNLKEKDLDCITSQQVAVQGGVELVMCGTVKPAGGGEMEVEATFITIDQTRFVVPPTRSSDAKEIAQHIFTSFETFVNQLRFVQFCTEDLGSSQWEMALERCDRALALNPESEPALYGKSYALTQLERYEEALEALRKLIDINPIHTEALQAAGYVAANLGRNDESRRYYREFLELNPGDIQIRLTIALDAVKAGDAEGALDIIEQGLVEAPEDLQLLEYAGYFAARAAAALVESANGAGVGDPSGKAEAQGFYQKAADYLQRVYTAKGAEAQTEVSVQLVNALVQLDRTSEAVDIGAKAVREKAGEAAVWRVYALALREAGQTADAISAMDSVLALDPTAPHIRVQQAQWLLQEGNLEAAGAAFKRAVDAGEIESESAGMNIFAIGVNEKFQKQLLNEAEPYFVLARTFVTTPVSMAMIDYFHGVIFYQRGIDAEKPGTAASARAALPLFQKALELFQKSGPYGETSPEVGNSIKQYLDGAQQYIEVQEALIRRGR